MPDFSNPFSGMKADRPLDTGEMLRALRFSVAAEFEAVQQYTQLADSVKDPLVKKVLEDIADEELVHAGEFMTLMKKINPDEETKYSEGEKEVSEMSKKAGISWAEYEKAAGRKNLTDELDHIASRIERENPQIARAIDVISDRIDHDRIC